MSLARSSGPFGKAGHEAASRSELFGIDDWDGLSVYKSLDLLLVSVYRIRALNIAPDECAELRQYLWMAQDAALQGRAAYSGFLIANKARMLGLCRQIERDCKEPMLEGPELRRVALRMMGSEKAKAKEAARQAVFA